MKRKGFYSVFFVLMLLSVGSIARRPMAFQKSAVITDRPLEPKRDSDNALDVDEFMGKIRFTDQSAIIYEVLPRKKYEETILRGRGNCSNLCFGAAYELRKDKIPFSIVFFLPRLDFLDGWGHAIVATQCSRADSSFACLVDVLESGLPMSGENRVHLEDLYEGAIADFSIQSLNPINNTNSRFYGEFLDRSTVGLLQGRDISEYFGFLERFYVPFGNAKLEKLAYDGLAVLVGVYPRIHVRSIEETFSGALNTRRFYLVVLWTLRLGVVLSLVFLGVELGRFRSRQRAHRGEGWSPMT